MSQAAYAVMNMGLRYYPVGRQWSIAVFATNLLGKDYFVSAFDFSGFTGAYNLKAGPPRRMGVNLKYRF